MPNLIDASGLQVATQQELYDSITFAMRTIYGNDINLDPDSPDAQLVNILIQAILDLENLLVSINSMFDPDQAIGTILDERCTLNGIQRQAGTYTITNVTVVTSASCTLYGLDQEDQPVYTVQDNAGNQWLLIETVSILGAGSQALAFRAQNPGAVLTTPNTITTPVTVVLNVLSVNNPTTYTTLGITEETDAELRRRRIKSVSLSSQGYYAGLLAALENLAGVSSAFVYENTSSEQDGNGVPGKSIWVIVEGGSASEIAQAIYSKRNAGCGMKGNITHTITQVDGTLFIVKWDTVTPVSLYIKFTATSLDGVNPPNVQAIREQLVTKFVPGVNEKVNVNALSTTVQEIDSNTLVTNAGFSTTVLGSYTSTLSTPAKNNQFAVTEANIIILPILLIPQSDTVSTGDTIDFSAYGGYGSYTYNLQVNHSGASINGSTGVYTAGSTPNSEDTVRVTDSIGNFTDTVVTVL